MKKLTAFFAATLVAAAAHAFTASLLSGAIATGPGVAVAGNSSAVGYKTYQAVCGTTGGTGSAVIAIEGSNDGVNFDPNPIVTFTVSLTTSTAPVPNLIATSADRPAFVRANITTLTGTGASCTVTMGY